MTRLRYLFAIVLAIAGSLTVTDRASAAPVPASITAATTTPAVGELDTFTSDPGVCVAGVRCTWSITQYNPRTYATSNYLHIGDGPTATFTFAGDAIGKTLNVKLVATINGPTNRNTVAAIRITVQPALD